MRDNTIDSLDRLPELDEKNSLPVVATANLSSIQKMKGLNT